MKLPRILLAAVLAHAAVLAQESDKSSLPEAGTETAPVEEENGSPPAEESDADRTRLNLLGEVDAAGGEARRNENVRLVLIDNNVLKELNMRMGATATPVVEFDVEKKYFATEFGGSPSRSIHELSSAVQSVHGSLFYTHENSVFSARSFFQVGGVKPSHSNDYGFNISAPFWEGSSLTLNGNQRRVRGQVNGNILVPAADERTPLTNDPEDRAIVQAIFNTYPNELPNVTSDRTGHTLNTSAPQNIDNDRIGGTFDQAVGDRDRFIARYGFTYQKVEAFQLAGGQNPDTTTRNHGAGLTWSRAWSPATTSDFTAAFDRTGSLLLPDDTSLGPYYFFGRELQWVGPDESVPLMRVQNKFLYGGRVRHLRGNHSLTFGGDVTRRQINGVEGNYQRGMFRFSTDFGRDLVTNLRMGTPSSYTVGIGNMYRGFRDWAVQFYASDDWHVTSRFNMHLGLQFAPVTRPSEVNGLTELPYASDWNNVAPQIGLAYDLPRSLGVIRAAYGLFYGEIFSATFLQSASNPPGSRLLVIQEPDLANPLAGSESDDSNPRTSVFDYDPHLTTPYQHLYTFTWEIPLPSSWSLDLAYVGSRSHRLLTSWILNRARVVPGIAQTSATIDARRPDPRYYDVNHIHNGSRGYYDAARITLRIPSWKGFTVEGSYWFSKAIDLGSDYTGTAARRDIRRGAGASEFDTRSSLRALSDFDQPHATLWNVAYNTPDFAGGPRWSRAIFASWQVSSVVLIKSGTPFEVRSGSDGPGYGNVDGIWGDVPNLLDPSILGRSIDNPDTSVQNLPRSAFAYIQPTDLQGNLGRNTFRKDGVFNINAAVSRTWNLRGEESLMFRVESLNLLNHPQFDEPGKSLASDTFATISNTLNDGRAFRFNLSLNF